MNTKYVIIGLIVVALIGFGFWQFGLNKKPTVGIEEKNTVTIETTTPDETTQSTYKNGTYEAKGGYVSPNGPEQIDITMTLKDDIVASAQFTGLGTHTTTKRMQGLFKAGFSEKVVGKPIDSIALTVVNGSSLTPKGFMDALEKIKAQAKA
ncbi:hypothetical protein A3D80_00610 [Candidatus Roizmanbacteria bacterium RIFCSPHIGHO2_02_FULL_40_13b]|uniref:FMN-binding domain-containing protein n=1 Tax=Candidatus Roizmanbacteria bacterium RIFCSPHIGHO2_01_FULL_39_24 TaxID=1802032 RepID=A0A1F7GKE3_9BACT|nr:MAG: hypothetical protein A2799_02575 [Candidatus Roizmanbacteria bacterium RIFCSPHIGHO2_01_FULL_39_24]OGK27448.1 MAG: hypothetical protein A3D80_00610 [Candidatus Roizmanbacteria bacterium RIFCSPHIGHO2_02_FULL_40_13b]OGK50005.1 MAG: hypothetical protein A3A56_00910 [Candidatus Roizmanbacteria bacterium RIFCSPLOWO2_01_FULL_40_32]